MRPERAALIELIDISLDPVVLLLQKALHRIGEARNCGYRPASRAVLLLSYRGCRKTYDKNGLPSGYKASKPSQACWSTSSREDMIRVR